MNGKGSWRVMRGFYLILGPLLFFLTLWVFNPENLSYEGKAVLASTLWIAVWWITEVVPIPVTSLLPIILFPLTQAISIRETTPAYANPIIYLYIGGFILANAIEKWNLHRRIALLIIAKVGINPRQVILGFMLATAFLSMWISNTATSVMMLPIGLAVIRQLDGNGIKSTFGKTLMLGIAYSASIGGIATLIGTPTNVVLVGVMKDLFAVEISFLSWIIFGLPISLILLIISWKYLVKRLHSEFNVDDHFILNELKALGKMGSGEQRVAWIFLLTAFFWITRTFLIKPWLPAIDDNIIALLSVFVLFLVPSGEAEDPRLITWKLAERIPWGIILLFGGGLAIANGFQRTGLAAFIGNQISALDAFPLLFILLVLITLVNFLTEITSNVATASMILPILAAMAYSLNVHPYLFMVAASIAASCAFMLPVATPPNAVVFGSGYIKMQDMVRTGFWLNLISIVVITIFIYWVLPYFWGFIPYEYPEGWVK